MKKTIMLSILACCLCVISQSQIEKSTFLLGGYSNFNLSTTGSYYLNLNPNSGYLLTDNVCLGLSAPIVFFGDQFLFGVLPFARFYMNKNENRSLFFSTSFAVTSFIESDNVLSYGPYFAGVGHVWMLNKSVGFETELVGNTNFENVNLGLYLGFQVYFNRGNS